MKCGIITVHSVYNYGAMFQAFALEYAMNRLNNNSSVQIINYIPDFLEDKKKIHFSRDIRSDLIECERIIMYSKNKRKGKCFQSFLSTNCHLSDACSNKAELSRIASEFDAVVSGSDQIWNYYITNADTSYLLDIDDFKGKKFSFSSSLGSYRYTKNYSEKASLLLSQYTSLSCRENDGCEYISELTGKNCVNTCDPTLLLSSEDYDAVCEKGIVSDSVKKAAKQKYLLIYNLSKSDELFSVAKEVADKRNLKIYQIFPSFRKNGVVDRLFCDASPDEFLYLFKNAEFVVTNSFHGTSFSLINNVDFYTISPTGSSNRILSLLEKCGISERLVLKDNLNSVNPEEKIDYDSVNVTLADFRKMSENYIVNDIIKKI